MMSKLYGFFLILALIIPGVSATWITAGQFEQTAQAVYSTDWANKTSDNNNATLWNSGSAGAKWLNWTNPSGYYIDSIKVHRHVSGDSPYILSVTCKNMTSGAGQMCMNNNTLMTVGDDTIINFDSTRNTSGYVLVSVGGGAGWTGLAEIKYGNYQRDPSPTIDANFNGTPLNGTAPLVVTFTDTSTASPTSWNWSSNPSTGVSLSSTTERNITMWFNLDGNYTITHGAANAISSDIETKTEYIHVLNSTELATTYVTAINALNAYPIHGAQVDLKDVENNTWSNTTTTDGTGSITTLRSHHVSAYVSATGFDSNDKLNFDSGGWESVLLYAPGLRNVTAGNLTLYVNVFDSGDHSKAIENAAVTVVSSSVAIGGYTNNAGIASFTVPNKTVLLVDVKALGQGYQGATQSVNTGTGSGGSASVTVTFYLNKNYVTPTATVTTLPGGGYPTTGPTVDAYPCDADHPENCQRKQSDMANLVIQYGPQLVMLFIVATIVGAMKMMGFR